MHNDVYGGAAGFGPITATPEIIASLSKLDRGYAVTIVKQPHARTFREDLEKVVVDDTSTPSEDEQIDLMVDGLTAFFRSIHGEQSDGAWRGEEDREKIRKAFKAVYGGRAVKVKYTPPPQPEVKQLAFESKEKLIEFLSANL